MEEGRRRVGFVVFAAVLCVCVCFARFENPSRGRIDIKSNPISLSLSLSLPPGCPDLIGIGISILGLDFFSLLFCISVPELNRIVFSGEEVLSLSLSPLPCFRFGWLMRFDCCMKTRIGSRAL